MAIILPRKGGFGETLGAGVSSGLQNLLQSLGTGLEQKQRGAQFEQAGVPGFLAGLEPTAQAAYLRNLGQSQKANVQANKPFIESTRKGADVSSRLLPLLDEALALSNKVNATGPVLGRLPAVSDEAQRLDSILNEILLEKAALQGVGQRGTNLYLKLQEAAKPSRKMNQKALQSRLQDIRKETEKLAQHQKFANEIIEANGGQEPSRIESLVSNVSKVYPRLPNPDEFEEGTIGDESGYLFEKRGNDWVFVGKSR